MKCVLLWREVPDQLPVLARQVAAAAVPVTTGLQILSRINEIYYDPPGVSSTEVLIVNFGDDETSYSLKILDQLHRQGIRTELFPDAVKLKKQMSYADSKKIPYIILAGEDEIKNETVIIKTMSSGEQIKMGLKDLDSFEFNNLRKN